MSDPVTDSYFNYIEMEERSALWAWASEIVQEMEEQEYIFLRKDNCFPEGSFTWDDDYICAGIKNPGSVQELGIDGLTMTIYGHGSVHPLMNDPEDDVIQEMVVGCGYPGEWTGSDWTLWFEENITIDKYGCEKAPRVIARYIGMKAQEIIGAFRKELDYIYDAIEEMENEMPELF